MRFSQGGKRPATEGLTIKYLKPCKDTNHHEQESGETTTRPEPRELGPFIHRAKSNGAALQVLGTRREHNAHLLSWRDGVQRERRETPWPCQAGIHGTQSSKAGEESCVGRNARLQTGRGRKSSGRCGRSADLK